MVYTVHESPWIPVSSFPIWQLYLVFCFGYYSVTFSLNQSSECRSWSPGNPYFFCLSPFIIIVFDVFDCVILYLNCVVIICIYCDLSWFVLNKNKTPQKMFVSCRTYDFVLPPPHRIAKKRKKRRLLRTLMGAGICIMLWGGGGVSALQSVDRPTVRHWLCTWVRDHSFLF